MGSQSQFGEEARPHLCMDKWNRSIAISMQLNLTPAVPEKIYFNRPGTASGYESTESGCILAALRVPYVIRPLRSVDAKSG